MLRTLKVAVTSVAVLGLIACSSSSSPETNTEHDSGPGGSGTGSGTGTGPGSGGPMTLTAFCNSVITAEATLASMCLGGTVAQYEAQEAAESGSGGACAALEAAVTAGRVTYDMSQGAACASAYSSLTCADVGEDIPEPPACLAALAGTVAKGASCYSSLDCVGGDSTTYCALTSTCSGKCATLVAAGGTCDEATDQCVSGYGCTSSGTGTSGTCAKNPETTMVAKGASCKVTGDTPVECETGLACNQMTQICETTIAQGDACTPGADVCAPFTYCDGSTKKCTTDPSAGGNCGASGTDTDYVPCLGATYCKTATGSESGVCTAVGGSGATCASSEGCLSNTCTIDTGATTGTCTAPCSMLD
jgi:hypothetical protein